MEAENTVVGLEGALRFHPSNIHGSQLCIACEKSKQGLTSLFW